jgi:catalase
MSELTRPADRGFPLSGPPGAFSLTNPYRGRGSPEAIELSKASLFQGASVPATFRFSSGSGILTAADGSPRANPHGLSIEYHLADGSEADMVLNSRKFFPVGHRRGIPGS